MHAVITVESPVVETARLAQVRGLFDLSAEKVSRLTWEVDLPLEETGCADRDLLDHCRSGGEHVRGCWAVDLLLGKE